MWLNERARQTGGAGYECAGVTLGGSQVETVASAHLRETPVYAPYGYAANVPAGAQVLLLSGGEDGAVVAGARMGSTDLAPGEVELRGPGELLGQRQSGVMSLGAGAAPVPGRYGADKRSGYQ